MKWITRERPKRDVLRIAAAAGAIPYDIPGVELSHVGKLCSFDVAEHTHAFMFRGLKFSSPLVPHSSPTYRPSPVPGADG
jgi:hypothetical protein